MERKRLYKYLMLFFALTVLGFGLACGNGGGSTAPKVSSTSPMNTAENVPFNSVVTATFSEDMDPLTISSATFRVTGPETDPVLGTLSYFGRTATFTPTFDLEPNTLFTVLITNGMKGTSGNSLEYPNYVWTFSTGAIPDFTLPMVTSTTPVRLETDVPFNSILTATFTEAMNTLTINPATFRLTGPGLTPVQGTVSYIGFTATFTPEFDLQPSTLFTATISTGAQDLAGNGLAVNYFWTFMTGDVPDTTPPTVSSTVPADAAVNVPVNRIISVGFSEVMDPATITTATFRVTGPGTVPVLGTVHSVGQTATFTPNNLLNANTLFTVTVFAGVKDAASNPLESNYLWTFTTAAILDTTPPTVTSTFPSNMATNVPLNRIITAEFTEPMKPTSINITTFMLTGPGIIPVSGTVTYSGLTATFTPTSPLTASTMFTATITTGVTDIANNPMASDYVWTFSTGAILDVVPPEVSSTVPADAAVSVPTNSKVSATFSEAMNPLMITTATFRLTGPGTTPVVGTVAYVGHTATFTPASTLAIDTLFTATITRGAKDVAGNPLDADYVWTFTTGNSQDSMIPTVTSTVPDDLASEVALNSSITATFSEAMYPPSITTTTFLLTGPGTTPVAGAVTYVGFTATFTPTNDLVIDTIYTATITTGAQDLSGNALAANYVWTFSTGMATDTELPTITSVLPEDLATDVALNSSITATFSEAMDPLTVSTASFLLTGPGTTSVSGSVTYLNGVGTFDPASDLAFDTEYTVTITTSTEDLAGNAMAANYVWTFTTLAEPIGPGVVDLGTAGSFVLLSKTGITTTGATSVVGDLGISPVAQSFYSGFSEILDSSGVFATATAIVTGKLFASDMATPTPDNLTTAITDMELAFSDAAGRTTPDHTELGAGDISGMTLTPGLYKWGSGLTISASGVTLSGGPNDTWVFQIASDLTVANDAVITLSGGALAKNIYWQVTGQVSLGTGSNFKGIILCQTQIVFQTGATFTGRALAQTLITLDAATITEP